MQKQENTPRTLINLRIDRALLDQFKQATKQKEETASQALRKYIKHYVKQAKAQAKAGEM